MATLLLLNHDHMGHGNAELGARILKTFLQKSAALRDLEAIAMVNGGVELVAPGSAVLGELTLLEENGVDLLPCGTCLQAYAVEPAVGRVSSMDEILAAMQKASKVITL
ncbi:MAG: sulfurtransferase-like selenium metabolism protein YedF [Planctomycetes bacterium]|nr:sulfurtransferase-like selenium metabolism protein YedF [Planctomycetota bacterium]MCB9909783.1 sulfurtransferase-like selenium metabolism protein YedF [Planctomycetota bacterium]MCB9912308.1 sulfurtransferase-like selenium metabolism protein YedF [Planctomycetota bacterium]HPF15659.1 sulfurtransferase-like selenium metabolism protein YedF [Planctomycetota bacterium]HRV81611.1 sulfurtransferase-like selenium metabolism protein YedF [Planctomycetota bacterium]